jgi:hypothetical protein
MKRIVLTGGGTGGHVTPNLALIPRLQADGWDVHYVGGPNSVEQAMIQRVAGVTYHSVSVGKLRRYFDPKNFSDIFRVLKGIHQARRIIRQLKLPVNDIVDFYPPHKVFYYKFRAALTHSSSENFDAPAHPAFQALHALNLEPLDAYFRTTLMPADWQKDLGYQYGYYAIPLKS